MDREEKKRREELVVLARPGKNTVFWNGVQGELADPAWQTSSRHPNLTAGDVKNYQGDKKRHLDELTERAREGDSEAFRERQAFLSRDPVDIRIEWEEFR